MQGEAGGESPDGSEDVTDLLQIWREYVDPGDESRDSGTRRLLVPLIEALTRTRPDADEAEDESRHLLEEIAARGEVGAAWDAVETLHLALDRAAADDAISPRDVSGLRRRLTGLQSRLHRAGLSTRLSVRRELLRDITHDLRVPLNSVVFLTESLLDEQHGELSDVQQRKLGGVYSASTTLLNFVNDLLDLSRSTEEGFECSTVPFSVGGVVDDVRHLVRPVADYQGAELEVDVGADDSWEGDPRLVRRVLLNLVTNGLEAAGDGGTVEVSVENGPDAASRRIVVLDTGPGIDLGRAEALLEPGDLALWRRLLNGTDGLGLLITGRLVRAAGGSVKVGHGESGGTRFVVELPFGAVG